MASITAIERALRERFGAEGTTLTLTEIVSFLQTYQNQHNESPTEGQQQPANGKTVSLPQGQSHDRRGTRQNNNNNNGAPRQGAQAIQISAAASQPPRRVTPVTPLTPRPAPRPALN